ncbi:MAG: hypothetical protein OXH76_07760, partial [Boseongicola sp.]|nr:hypothetical protein [Boseongicola sp.]
LEGWRPEVVGLAVPGAAALPCSPLDHEPLLDRREGDPVHRIRGDPDLALLDPTGPDCGERVAKSAGLGDCDAKWPLISLSRSFWLPVARNTRRVL